jgi:uncharacterized protein YceH (UPF0502 family)
VTSGFQPRTTPAERRSDIDLLRRVTELERQVAALQATVADHETRIDILEP